MHHISDCRFVLTAPLADAPAGATGQLKRLGADYVSVVFDETDYPEMVFDVHDTGPEVRQSIKPLRNPMPLRLKAALWLYAAFALGWAMDPPMVVLAQAMELVEKILPIPPLTSS